MRHDPVMKEHGTSQPIVFVIDDDASVCVALKELFQSVRIHVELFPSASAFLENHQKNTPSCLVLDVRLPGMSGLKFQEKLATAKIYLPMVFLTGRGDIPMAVRAMKAGAVDFLTKPFRSRMYWMPFTRPWNRIVRAVKRHYGVRPYGRGLIPSALGSRTCLRG